MTKEPTPLPIAVHSGGEVWSGWLGITVSRAFKQAAASFDLSVAGTSRAARAIQAMEPVEIYLADRLILSGYVDAWKPSATAEGGATTVSGRSKTGDLVDCAAMVKPGQWFNAAPARIVADLLTPFGLTAVVDAARPIGVFEVEPGETVFAALDRLAKIRGMVVTDRADGALVMTRPNAATAPRVADLLHKVGSDGRPDPSNNVLSLEMEIRADKRFSEVIVIGQTAGSDALQGLAATHVRGVARDPLVSRYRPLMIKAECDAGDMSPTERAQWELARRIGASLKITATVRGWIEPSSGGLWGCGMVARLISPSHGIDKGLMISAVALSVDSSAGRITRLTLEPPEAWLLREESDKKTGGPGGGDLYGAIAQAVKD